jgi:hypothetical protein
MIKNENAKDKIFNFLSLLKQAQGIYKTMSEEEKEESDYLMEFLEEDDGSNSESAD